MTRPQPVMLPARRRRGRDQQWMLTALPAFPLLLLVLRLWYLSRQDLQTMLLLVQNVSPLGLIGSLLITLIWVPPVFILVGRALGALLLVSSIDAGRSWLARAAGRTPGWVVLSAFAVAAVTWQLRFLPTLGMLLLVIFALDVRLRYEDHPQLIRMACIVVPVVCSVLGLLLFGPATLDAVRAGEPETAFLLIAPVVALPFLTGPVPAPSARLVTHWVAMAGLVIGPILVAAIFVQAPVLPAVAVELKPDALADSSAEESVGDRSEVTVVRGQVITVDDRATTLLESGGKVEFVANDAVISQVLCPDPIEPPYSAVEVHGWQVERAMLSWLAPSRSLSDDPDPRCLGRPARPGGG
ncbi:hypothetical protein [Cryptosporangium aurantiacum]|uniref:Uncharacterized protein n=1 Tax=Cryptosporangium aurantiacum TaxID=134849 RepID=A0A1M7RDD5_9ACTN|nr:hypothetical protein [Cryptosporangium aurantiacum]SHN44181.1 hypothetical protein SAMN05443668_110100 [Cryptosporangium aurantiacum]